MDIREADELRKKLNEKITLTDTVNAKVEDAYQQIRRQSQEKMKYPRLKGKKWVVLLAACMVLAGTSAVVLAATGFFQKKDKLEAETLTYEFTVDYELKPGTFQVTANYIPEGYVQQEEGKYSREDNWGHGISILPIMNTADLAWKDKEIQKNHVENVEKAVLSGMDAEVLTFTEADKYQRPKEIFLFNPQEGYVVEVWGDYSVPMEELKKVADNLTVERTGDADYVSDEQKAEAEKAQAEMEQHTAQIEETNAQGVLDAHIIPAGKTGTEERTGSSYTILGAEFTDKLADYKKENFYDYSYVEKWLRKDGTLKPYLRQHLDREGNILEESSTEQCFLTVKVRADKSLGEEAEEWQKDTALDARLQRLGQKQEGGYGWVDDTYQPVPSEEYELQIDNRCVYFDQPQKTEGEERAHSYFYRNMEDGESLEYTLIFVVDKDVAEGNLVLDFNEFANVGTAEGIYFAIK